MAKTFSVVLDDDTVAKLNTIAEVKGVPRNRILTQLVDRYVEDNYQKALESKQALDKAKEMIARIE